MKFLFLLFLLPFKSFSFEVKSQDLGLSQKVNLSWELSEDKSSRRLRQIEINGGKIDIDGEWLNADEEAEIESIDLNFDKKSDYAITIRRGVSNRYILYLLWDEAIKKFISLGVRPELTLVDKSKCWTGFEKGNESKAVNLRVEKNKFINCSNKKI